MIVRSVMMATAIVVGLSAAMAQQEAVKARKDLMADNGKQFYGVLGKIQRGQDPYDQAKVDAAFAALLEDAKKTPAAFERNVMPSTPSDYDSSAKVWQNKSDFDAKVASFTKVLADNRTASKDLETLKAAYKNVSESCSGCHETSA